MVAQDSQMKTASKAQFDGRYLIGHPHLSLPCMPPLSLLCIFPQRLPLKMGLYYGRR